jgi:hypothetical protein
MSTLEKFLRRYTDIPALIYMLTEKRITLLDPETWDDKNDSHFLQLYREKNHLQCVLALCFSQHSETYHHWRVFANGASGVCINFKREQLLRAIRQQSGVRMGQVKYLKLPETKGMKPLVDDLPFLKRYPFEQENEFRVIFGSRQKLSSLDIPISLECIERVTLSPWLHPVFSEHIKKTLKQIKDCGQLKIARSTLISNEEWKDFGDRTVRKQRRRSRWKGV